MPPLRILLWTQYYVTKKYNDKANKNDLTAHNKFYVLSDISGEEEMYKTADIDISVCIRTSVNIKIVKFKQQEFSTSSSY